MKLKLALLLTVSAAANASDSNLSSELAKHQLVWDAVLSLAVTKSSVHEGDTLKFQTLVAEGGNTRLELSLTDPIERKQADKTVRLRYLSIQDLYSARNTPYYGALTNLSECPPDKKPEEVHVKILGQDRDVLLLNASANFAFGVWDKEEVKQRAAFLMLYEESKKVLIEIKVFQPSETFSKETIFKMLQSLQDT